MDEPVFASIIWGLIVVAIFMPFLINSFREEAKKKKKEEEERQRRIKAAEAAKAREKDMAEIIQFAKSKGIYIEGSLEERNSLYKQAARNYALGRFTMPLKPTTVKSFYSGTITDHMAKQINKEREQDYERMSSSSSSNMNNGLRDRARSKRIENQILDKLRNTSDGEKYAKLLEQYFEEDDRIFHC